MIGAACFADQGFSLWSSDADDGIVPPPSFQRFIKLYQFKEFRQFVVEIMADESLKDSDPWWRLSSAVEEFNQRRRETVEASVWGIIDELMSAFRPRSSAKSQLPNISYIKRKPEPLGGFSTFLLADCSYFSCLTIFFCFVIRYRI